MGATTEFALVYFGLFSLASGCTRLTSQSVSLSLSRDPVITRAMGKSAEWEGNFEICA